ncbi:hypothetical protein Cgig2_021356 [Carnegiea gigantea]|uniref:Uncharacterized protein n=1 Tax=Carnegiea gigantea TaxID=171969 RepID=A0A9Q1GIC6_9CARY|nr:hypothetical protein Cgig2_021356 [Carnegiea gigantea]
MVQAIFYAMVVDDATALGLSRRLTMDCMMWAMWKLDWGPVESKLVDINRRLRRAQASRRAKPLIGATPSGGPTGRRVSSFPTFCDTTYAAEYVKDNLCWSVRESSSLHPNLLSLHFVALCPDIDHTVAMQFAHAVHIPEMVQAIFYAMVINEAVELRLLSRETMESLILDLQEMSGDVPEGLASPQVEGCNLQFPSLPAFIDGRAIAGVP